MVFIIVVRAAAFSPLAAETKRVKASCMPTEYAGGFSPGRTETALIKVCTCKVSRELEFYKWGRRKQHGTAGVLKSDRNPHAVTNSDEFGALLHGSVTIADFLLVCRPKAWQPKDVFVVTDGAPI